MLCRNSGRRRINGKKVKIGEWKELLHESGWVTVTHYSKQWANLALTEEVLLGLKAGEQRGGTWRHMLREAK